MASIGNIGDKLDLLFRQGSALGPIPCQMLQPGSVNPVDLTGCTIRAKIGKTHKATTTYPVVVQITVPLEGRFVFSVADEVTAVIPCGTTQNDDASKYVWDMEIEYSDGTVKPLFYGVAKVAPEVTK